MGEGVFTAQLVSDGVFADGKEVVIDASNNRFPPICMRCGHPTDEADKQKYLFRTKGLKAAFWGRATKPCQVYFHPKCAPKHDTVPIWADALARILMFMAVGTFVVGFAVPISAVAGTLIALAALWFLASIVKWLVLVADIFVNFHPIRITKRDSDDDFIWVKGVHPDFLNSLPPL